MILFIRLANLAAFLFAMYLPYAMYTAQTEWEETVLTAKSTEVETKTLELATKTALVKRAEEFRTQRDAKIEALRALRLAVDEQAKLVPKRANLRDILKALADRADTTGLEFSSFKPETQRRVKFLVLSPVTVELRGTYTQVMSFLDAAANMERAVTTENLNIGTTAGEDRTSSSMITASATLIAYHLDEAQMAAISASAAQAAQQGAPPPAAGAAPGKGN